MTAAAAGYVPGGWVAISAPDTWLLVELPPDHPIVQRIWALLSQRADVEELLDAIASGGLRDAPSFALLSRSGSHPRAVARGGAHLLVITAGGRRTIAAEKGLSWVDELVDADPNAVELRSDLDQASTVELPMASGVTMASRVLVRFGEAAVIKPAEPPAVAVVEPPAVEEDSAADAQAGAEDSVPEEDEPSYDFLFGATQRPPSLDETDGGAAGADAAEADAAQQVAATPTPDPGETAGWHTTSAELGTAAVDPYEPAEPAPPPPPPGGLIDALPWATPAPPPTDDAPRWTPPTPAAAPVAGVPPLTPPAQVPVPNDPVQDQGQDDVGQTIDRSAVRAGLSEEPLIAGPTVLAGHCSSGHLSPPHASVCRVCGTPMPAQDAFEIARPSLGVLRLSTGDVVTLDRGVLLGRAPAEPAGTEERPHLVKLASPENDISRNHAEVVLDGWHVFVRDLGSTNGTVVTLPGQAPTRLREHDLQLLEHGATVTLADEVSFVFEVTG